MIFLMKILLQFKNLLQIVDLMYQLPKCPNTYFPQALELHSELLNILNYIIKLAKHFENDNLSSATVFQMQLSQLPVGKKLKANSGSQLILSYCIERSMSTNRRNYSYIFNRLNYVQASKLSLCVVFYLLFSKISYQQKPPISTIIQ